MGFLFFNFWRKRGGDFRRGTFQTKLSDVGGRTHLNETSIYLIETLISNFLSFYAIIIATTFSVLYSSCPVLVMSCVSPAKYKTGNVRCHIGFCTESSVITARFLVERQFTFSYITKYSFLEKVKNELFESFL